MKKWCFVSQGTTAWRLRTDDVRDRKKETTAELDGIDGAGIFEDKTMGEQVVERLVARRKSGDETVE